MCTLGAAPRACTRYTIGKTTPAATSDCTAPAAIFSSPTIQTGTGASTRSSISLLKLNSCTSGSATAWMPWKLIATAMRPGTRTVVNDTPAGPSRKPWPIFGKT